MKRTVLRTVLRTSPGLRRPNGVIRSVLDVAYAMRLRGDELRQFHDYARARPYTGPGALAAGYWLHKQIHELTPKLTLPPDSFADTASWSLSSVSAQLFGGVPRFMVRGYSEAHHVPSRRSAYTGRITGVPTT